MLHSSRRFWASVPPASLGMFLGAVFALFSTVALTRDISSLGQLPGPHLAILTLVSGLFAVSWAMVVIRGARWLLVSVVVLGLLIVVTRVMAVPVPTSSLDADAVASIRDRLRLDSALVIAAVMAGYVFFVTFLAGEGARYLKAHTEIALAREIHQLLVPPIARRVGPFEFYGASLPSGEVGGDLIDLVETRDAWATAYGAGA